MTRYIVANEYTTELSTHTSREYYVGIGGMGVGHWDKERAVVFRARWFASLVAYWMRDNTVHGLRSRWHVEPI